jgi:hypothetical protein
MGITHAISENVNAKLAKRVEGRTVRLQDIGQGTPIVLQIFDLCDQNTKKKGAASAGWQHLVNVEQQKTRR